MSDKKYSVLVVDDQANWRELLVDLLKEEFDVKSAKDYEDALNLAQSQPSPFHVVVTDMRLKDDEIGNVDGLKLIEYINKLGGETEGIVLTGYGDVDTTKKALSHLGAFDYLEKHPPTDFNYNEFKQIVRSAASEADKRRNKIDIFVVMPFAEEYDHVYEYIQEIAQGMNKVCKRADRSLGAEASSDIISDIDYGIENAEVVIAELSGVKPNVLFESGASYALQKKVILIAQKSDERSIPEILSRRRIIFYPGKFGGEKVLKGGLSNRLKEEFAKGKITNTVSVVDPSLCFVITSPEDDGHDTFDAIIKRAVDKAGIKSIYLWNKAAWDKPGTETSKHAMIEEKLREAGCVIADLSGNDPTAFYLAGLAYRLRKNYKFLYRQDKKPPFDIRYLNLIRHSKNNEAERDEARNELLEWLQSILKDQTVLHPSSDMISAITPKIGRDEKQTRIMFLAAEPKDQVRLRLGQEFREIRDELLKSPNRDCFALESPELSLRSKDITRALLDTNASIVHFSGHGGAGGQLIFESGNGAALPVAANILADLFDQFSEKVKCVILNACYSEKQAKAISQHIDYVIGMKQGISDDAAIAFSIGFYQALGAGRTIEKAFELGKIQNGLQSASEYETPVLLKRSS